MGPARWSPPLCRRLSGWLGPGTPPLRPRLEGVTCPPRPPVHGNVLGTRVPPRCSSSGGRRSPSPGQARQGAFSSSPAAPFSTTGSSRTGFWLGCPTKGELDGKFAGALIRSTGVELFTDALGAGSVYYATRGPDTFFSSHLGLLLGSQWQPALNDLGLAGQLFARSQIFDKTHFSGVFRLPAGQRLVAGSEWSHARAGIRRLVLPPPRHGRADVRPRGVLGDGRGRRRAAGFVRSGFRADVFRWTRLLGRRARAFRPPPAVRHLRRSLLARLPAGDATGEEAGARVPRPSLYEDWTLDTYSPIIVGLHAGCSGLQTANNLSGFDGARELATLAAVGFLGNALTGAHSGPRPDPDDAYALRILLPNHKDPVLNGDVFEPERDAIIEHVLSRFHDLSHEAGSTRQALMILDLEWRQARWISMMFDLCN